MTVTVEQIVSLMNHKLNFFVTESTINTRWVRDDLLQKEKPISKYHYINSKYPYVITIDSLKRLLKKKGYKEDTINEVLRDYI